MVKKKLTYKLKKLIPGHKIEAGLSGCYAGIPDKNYKNNPFDIYYVYYKLVDNEMKCIEIVKEVKDWNRAEKFRKFMDRWGRGAYTLGYFKMCETL